MKVWLSTVGTSPFAVINTLWAACKEENYTPNRIYLVKNNEVERRGFVNKAKNGIQCILKEYGIDTEIILIDADETDFKNFASKLGDIVRKEKYEGNEVAIDMTPGRKFMSALSMYLGTGDKISTKADRVYYLFLSDTSYQDKPFMLIPKTVQTLFEMKKSLSGNGK